MAKADEALTKAVDGFRKVIDAAKAAAKPAEEQPPAEQPPVPGKGQ